MRVTTQGDGCHAGGEWDRTFVPTCGPEDWKRLLADPAKHWRSGFSAKALAYSWEEADGFPQEVKEVFSRSKIPVLQHVEILLALPEYKVPLPGGRAPSQNDIFVLARSKSQGKLIAVAVEGKVAEPFGPTLEEWLEGASKGKRCRLEYLCRLLEIEADCHSIEMIRYQLMHRTASALILAKQFNADAALMLVHSFSQEHEWFEDYRRFLQLYGRCGEPNSVTSIGERNGIATYASWVVGNERYLKT